VRLTALGCAWTSPPAILREEASSGAKVFVLVTSFAVFLFQKLERPLLS
jgi:hypothetical protein